MACSYSRSASSGKRCTACPAPRRPRPALDLAQHARLGHELGARIGRAARSAPAQQLPRLGHLALARHQRGAAGLHFQRALGVVDAGQPGFGGLEKSPRCSAACASISQAWTSALCFGIAVGIGHRRPARAPCASRCLVAAALARRCPAAGSAASACCGLARLPQLECSAPRVRKGQRCRAGRGSPARAVRGGVDDSAGFPSAPAHSRGGGRLRAGSFKVRPAPLLGLGLLGPSARAPARPARAPGFELLGLARQCKRHRSHRRPPAQARPDGHQRGHARGRRSAWVGFEHGVEQPWPQRAGRACAAGSAARRDQGRALGRGCRRQQARAAALPARRCG
jgi:hypothetical protein